MTALSAAALSALADQIEERLDNELADRQAICEDVAVELRGMAAAARSPGGDGADQRVTAAREFLDGARRRKVGELPPSLLVRECAELRRLLGQALDVIHEYESALEAACGVLLDSAVTLDEDQAATVTAALDDAVAGIRARAARCGECEISPAGLCDGCADRLARVDLYAELAAQIGGAR